MKWPWRPSPGSSTAEKGGSIEPPIVSRFWVMNGTAGTAAAPWFQLVVLETVAKS